MEKRRVIFVGMHNKPDKVALCSSTKSGKLVDRVALAGNFTHIKTNLYNVDYYPKSEIEKSILANDWIVRVDPAEPDVIVLLGAEVHNNFKHSSKYIVKIPHPSSQWSHEQMNTYVENAVKKIQALNPLK
jgi:hypothetical protein